MRLYNDPESQMLLDIELDSAHEHLECSLEFDLLEEPISTLPLSQEAREELSRMAFQGMLPQVYQKQEPSCQVVRGPVDLCKDTVFMKKERRFDPCAETTVLQIGHSDPPPQAKEYSEVEKEKTSHSEHLTQDVTFRQFLASVSKREWFLLFATTSVQVLIAVVLSLFFW
ncbi:MAG: hypothetical protein H6727_06495 [Myxococcales bacterium]|nr:hypothetical protein [Myxococcales bacterium]